MKTRITFLGWFIFLSFINGLNAQTSENYNSAIPLKSGNSILFGKDIIINDQPSQNQRFVKLCSAFNGWLYAVYTHKHPTNGYPAFTIMRSEDSGITWSVFINDFYPLQNSDFTSMDLITGGDSLSNLKVLISFVVSTSPTTAGIGQGYIGLYNGISGAFETLLINETQMYSLVFSSDYLYPASYTNPHSIGVLYSKNASVRDSLIFRSSSNGGISLNPRKIIAITTNHFHKVALAYGKCPSWNSGRYYAAWEEKDGFGSGPGHIYTAHSTSNINSPFTTPLCLDSLDASSINQSKNPVIACQYNNIDNDSLNITEIVLFDKYLPASNKFDIDGFYNMTSTNTTHFTKFSLNTSSDNIQQPDINFNPFDSSFMVTYYDSTTQKLPFLKKNYNMINPDTWQIITPGYNDNNDLAKPYPKVVLDIGQQQGANVWAREGASSYGVAMFDAPYSTWTGFSENDYTEDFGNFRVYPNPCNSSLTVGFELKESEKVYISLNTLIGKPVGLLTAQTYHDGNHLINYDVSCFPEGSYILLFSVKKINKSFKIVIIK